MKIAVIAGAGPAGLTAAYELLKRTDIRPIVFEKTETIGGIAQTFNYKGNHIDIGGHRFFSKSDRVMKWWFNILPIQGKPAADSLEKGHDIDYATEAIIDALCEACAVGEGEGKIRQRPAPDPEKEEDVMLQRPRLSRIFHHRHLFPYPIAITMRVAWKLGLLNTFLIGLSYIKVRLSPLRDETYLDAFYINRFGKRLYKTFFESYTEKVWGVPCSQIRADWGAQRVKGLSLRRAVTHAIKDLFSSDFKKSQQERETSLITRFYYPKFGPGQMWETVARHVAACGGEVRRSQAVVRVHCEDGRVSGVTVRDGKTGNEERVACDYFFSTMPVKELVAAMDPVPPQGVRSVAQELQYRDFLTVGLLLKKLHIVERGENIRTSVPDNWIYIQEGDVKVGRVQVFNNWSPYMVADRKNTLWIGLEYFVNENHGLWVLPDKDLIRFGIGEMEKIKFLRGKDVLDACVLRMPKAYPAYIGSYDRLSEIYAYADGIPNLYLIGRNGMHRYNNQDHSMLTAMTAVDNIVAGITTKANLWAVNAEAEYHEGEEVKR
ncbi:MAG: NAD(P)/FAD-dependent oxidoreductase [Candidatus Peribacteraceae bacterium]|nr:NAD(P)/FAD-dependent oxidoreductase [Candidatus Peribacteraceae bacterium]